MPRAGASARAQKKVALQSKVMPNSRFERNEAHSAVTQKKLADEAAAFSAAIAPVPPEEEAAFAATSSAKLLRATKRIFDFKVNFHDSLRKKSCAIQRQPQQPFDNSTKESSLVSGLAAVRRFYEDRKRAERKAEQEQPVGA